MNSWTTSGDARIRTNRDGPYSGSSHARLRRSSGYISRGVDLSNQSGVHVQFWAKVRSFENSDKAYVRVSADGITWTTVKTLTVTDSDNTYHFHDIDLSSFTMSSEFYVAFDAEMSGRGDWWYIDSVTFVG